MRAWRAPQRTVVAAAAVVLALAGGGCTVVAESPPSAAAGAATSQLAALTVADPGSMRGYRRDRFPHWRSVGEHCDVRDTVLRRDAEQVRLDGCDVAGGRWFSVYDRRTLADPGQVDIDHMVPLANAWRSGAAAWDDERRADFGNDLTRPQLIAVSAASNRAKGDQDPAQWKPPNRAYWCQYARDWIAVKHFWRLTVTAEEKAALTDMVGTCQPDSSVAQTSRPGRAG